MKLISVLFALLLHIAVAFGNRLEERVNYLQDRFKIITRHILPKIEDHLTWVERNEDFILSVENNEFQAQETLTRALQEMAERLSRVEEQQQQQQQEQCSCLPKGVSFACPSGYVEVGEKCVFFSNTTYNYDGAKNECSEAGGRLLINDNCNLMQNIAEYLDNAGVDKFWVGATDVEEEGNWVWSNGKDVRMGATSWGRRHSYNNENEPSGNVSENCLLMRTGNNFLFGDSNCETYTGTSPLCQYDDGTCSSPRVLLEGRCLEFLSDVEVDWSGAGAACVAIGGKLAKVDDCNFLGAISAYLLNSGTTPSEGYWLGGNDIAEEGTWLWQDGSLVTMGTPFWCKTGSSVLQPDNDRNSEHCAVILLRNRWRLNDMPCSSTDYHAACEAPHVVV